MTDPSLDQGQHSVKTEAAFYTQTTATVKAKRQKNAACEYK